MVTIYFIQPLIDDSDIHLNHKATSINLEKKEIIFANGLAVGYQELVSTLPLPMLIELCGESVPNAVKLAATELEATSIDLISVGFNKPLIKTLWFYIYDNDIYASGAYSPSIKSPDNVPINCSSLQFEIYNPSRERQYCPKQLKRNVLYALQKMKIANTDDIVFMHHKHLPWGNVIFKRGMESSRAVVREFINQYNIKSAGRFGEWGLSLE